MANNKILNLDLDNTLGGDNPSDFKAPSQKAIKEYVDDKTIGVVSDTSGDIILGAGGSSGDVPIATTSVAGKVKPDGTTITVTSDGTISSTGGTSDHSALTNLDYAHAGHTGFMSSENFLPTGTIITVETDGSGDFTTLADAVNYLIGKWSNGNVTVQIGTGTFVLNAPLEILLDSFDIPRLNINGSGVNNTIIQGNNTNYIIVTNPGSGHIIFSNIQFYDPDGAISKTSQVLRARIQSSLTIGTCTFNKCGFYTYRGCNVDFNSNIVFSGGTQSCISCSNGSRISGNGPVTFSNCTDAILLRYGGTVCVANWAITLTSVTNMIHFQDTGTKQTPNAGTIFYNNADGIIYGKFSKT